MNSTYLLNEIDTKDDFIRFLQLFNKDLVENGGEWENSDLESFLSGMEGFLIDSTEKSLIVVDFTPSWKLFAKIFLASSIYE